MNTPTIWLLDNDGPINAQKAGWSAPPRRRTIWVGARKYRMSWSPALLNRIGGLHRSGLVEARWCSTWCPWAHLLERLYGLPPLPRAFSGEIPHGPAGDELKLAVALQILREGRRLIWTDDTAIPQSGPEYDELTESGRALLIAPSPRRGLRPEHMDAIEAFAAQYA